MIREYSIPIASQFAVSPRDVALLPWWQFQQAMAFIDSLTERR